MNEYLAIFYTHFAAICTARSLEQSGVSARLLPVPRQVSASCGTCVRYAAGDPCMERMAKDTECVYRVTDGGYEVIRKFD